MQNDLITYLDNVIQLEKAIYLQSGTINNIRRIIDELRVPRDIQPPTESDVSFVWDGWNHPTNKALSWFVGCLLGMLLVAFITIAGFQKIILWPVFVIGIPLGLTGGRPLARLLCGLLFRGKKAGEIRRINSSNQSLYQQALNAEQTRMANCTIQIQHLEFLMQKLIQSRANTSALLQEYYCKNTLYPKYWNFIAVTSFYDYLRSKRCDSLHGPDGAYNLFEAEQRMNTIISRLDHIIVQLEDIKANQRALYSAVKTATQKIDELTWQTQQLVENSSRMVDLTAESNRQSAQQTKALNFIANNSSIIAYNAWQDAREREYKNWLTDYKSFS